MRVAVVGSRSFPRLEMVRDFVAALPVGTVVVSGGAAGVDSAAAVAAQGKGLQLQIFYPDWVRYGRGAGFIRNKLIVDAADVVVAFWDGVSRGTKNTLDCAQEMKKPYSVIAPHGSADAALFLTLQLYRPQA